MGIDGFSISASIIIVIVLLLIYGKALKRILERISIEKLRFDRMGGLEISLRPQNVDPPKSMPDLGKIGKHPPDQPEEVVRDLTTIIQAAVVKQNPSNAVRQVEALAGRTAQLELDLLLERISAVIFGSQIKILEYLNSMLHASKEQLQVFYEAAKQQNPKIYENIPFDKYLEFLTSFWLIKQAGSKYSITGVGRAFLILRVKSNRTAFLPPL